MRELFESISHLSDSEKLEVLMSIIMKYCSEEDYEFCTHDSRFHDYVIQRYKEYIYEDNEEDFALDIILDALNHTRVLYYPEYFKYAL